MSEKSAEKSFFLIPETIIVEFNKDDKK